MRTSGPGINPNPAEAHFNTQGVKRLCRFAVFLSSAAGTQPLPEFLPDTIARNEFFACFAKDSHGKIYEEVFLDTHPGGCRQSGFRGRGRLRAIGRAPC
jgi:hypothetical protein